MIKITFQEFWDETVKLLREFNAQGSLKKNKFTLMIYKREIEKWVGFNAIVWKNACFEACIKCWNDSVPPVYMISLFVSSMLRALKSMQQWFCLQVNY